jgi:hypothetical protein
MSFFHVEGSHPEVNSFRSPAVPCERSWYGSSRSPEAILRSWILVIP